MSLVPIHLVTNFRAETIVLRWKSATMMNLFRKKESKKSEFEIEEDDEEKGEYTNYS